MINCRKKRIWLAVGLIITSILISGCKSNTGKIDTPDSGNSTETPDSSIETEDNTVDRLEAVYELKLQKNYHDDKNVVEIPLFYSDYNSSVIKLLNSTIKDEIVRLCDEYEQAYGYNSPKNSLKLRCYTDTTEKYLQAIVTYSTELLTSNNNDGFVYSYIYDIENDHLVTLNDAMSMSSINIQTIWEKAAAFVYEQYGETGQLLGCEPAAFRLLDSGSVIYLYMTINNDGYVSERIGSLISATGERGEVCEILEGFDFNASDNAEWTLPIQLELYDEKNDRCVYKDTDYGVSIEFPKDITVSIAYESGYAAFASKDRTASAVYFTETGRNIKELELLYPDGKNENGIFKASRVSTDYTEYIFAVQSKLTDQLDEGYTHWLIVTTDSTHTYSHDSASISLSDAANKAETPSVGNYILTDEQKTAIDVFAQQTHAALYASLGKANYGVKNTLLIPSDIFKGIENGQSTENIIKSLTTSYQIADRATARLSVSGHIIPRQSAITELTLSIVNGNNSWLSKIEINIG